jgi:hypothetical protein
MEALLASTIWGDFINTYRLCLSCSNLSGHSNTSYINGTQMSSWLCTINISVGKTRRIKNKTNTMKKCSMSSFLSFFAVTLMNRNFKLFWGKLLSTGLSLLWTSYSRSRKN